ncbi:MAG: pilus assembly protein [Chloroflexi bacterium]|nr:MAG: pilus assembly protein [Chloroflexota bacterium]
MKHRGERAQSMVEMAMIAPILVFILLAVIDFGRAAYDYATLAGAVRDGARSAITSGANRPTSAQVVVAVEKSAFGLQLAQGSCVNDPAPASPSMSANTGLVYVGAGPDNSETNAPAGESPAGPVGSCAAVVPSLAGHYQLQVTAKFKFTPLTPFASQFFPGGLVMTVSSTMSTEY